MERRSIEAIAGALEGAGVRYLVVGEVAVVAHGFVRFTADLDLVLDPDPAAPSRAVEALASLGYRPPGAGAVRGVRRPRTAARVEP